MTSPLRDGDHFTLNLNHRESNLYAGVQMAGGKAVVEFYKADPAGRRLGSMVRVTPGLRDEVKAKLGEWGIAEKAVLFAADRPAPAHRPSVPGGPSEPPFSRGRKPGGPRP